MVRRRQATLQRRHSPGLRQGASRLCGLAVAIASAVAGGGAAEQPAALGLTVQNGIFIKDGRPYHGIGANYFGLFHRLLKDAEDTSTIEGLRRLSEAGIPFVRFMASGFWPADWTLYREDATDYFARLDRVVRAAEDAGVGLIPCIFWHAPTVSDIVGEPFSAWGDEDSRTVEFMRRYTREVVSRYRDSPAVWAWEMSNEMNLAVDLPNAREHRPGIVPELGTPTERSERDELTSRAMLAAFDAFAGTVRELDSHRALITGNSIPRPSAYHNTLERSWTRDTRAQFRMTLERDNPDPFDTISVHLYPNPREVYFADGVGRTELIPELVSLATDRGKAVFVGEFGVCADLPEEEQRDRFSALLSCLVENEVSLAAFWVFDHPHQESQWNVSFDNRRVWMIDAVAEANGRLRRGVVHPPDGQASVPGEGVSEFSPSSGSRSSTASSAASGADVRSDVIAPR